MKAREKLIEHNLRLVAHIVKKYYTSADDQDDLISIGTIGLIKAIDSFDPKNGARFATYGAKCLQNEILMYFRQKKKTSAEVSINETINANINAIAMFPHIYLASIISYFRFQFLLSYSLYFHVFHLQILWQSTFLQF